MFTGSGTATGPFALEEVGSTRYDFDYDGRMTRRERLNGHGVTFEYSGAAGTVRRLTCVRNDSGQAVIVTTAADGGVAALALGNSCIDSSPETLTTFARTVGSGLLRLDSVSYPTSPSASRWSFTYGGGILGDKVTLVHFGDPAAPILQEGIEWETGTNRVSRNFTPSSAFEFRYADPSCAGTLVIDLAESDPTEASSCITFDPITRSPVSRSGPCRCGDSNFTYGYTAVGGGIVIQCSVDREGVRTSFAFDAEARVTERVDNDDDCDAATAPAAGVQTFFYYGNACPRSPTEVRRRTVLPSAPDPGCTRGISAGCHRMLYQYDSACNTVQVEERGWTFADTLDTIPDPLCIRTQRCFDSAGRIVREVGPEDCALVALDCASAAPVDCAAATSRGTTFTYWPAADADPLRRNRPAAVHRCAETGPSSVRLSDSFTSYDQAGYLLSSSDPNGVSTTRAYRPGRPGLEISTSVGGETTEVFLDAAERTDRIRRPAGDEVDYQYSLGLDGFARLSAVVEPGGDTRSLTYVFVSGVSAGAGGHHRGRAPCSPATLTSTARALSGSATSSTTLSPARSASASRTGARSAGASTPSGE